MSPVHLAIDALIILAYFAVIMYIGLRMGRRDDSLQDFALGGRNVPWWAVMASIIATETSAATFLGTPGEGYKAQSIAYAQLVIGLIMGRMLVGYIFLKPYYLYKVYTVYDYLGIRFGEKSRTLASALFLVMRTCASGARVFIPALVMVLAFKMFASGNAVQVSLPPGQRESLLPYAIAIILVVIATTLYTAVGGIKAVIWTDVVQASLMFVSAFVAILTLLYHIGGDSWNLMNGFQKLGELVPNTTKLQGYFWFGWEPERVAVWVKEQADINRAVNPNPATWGAWEWFRMTIGSPYTLFSATIGAIFGNMAAFGTDQDMVQRLLTAETYKKSRRSLITAAVMDLPIAAGFCFIGVLLAAYYQIKPEFKPGNPSDVFGSYILNVMPVGIRGFVLAGVFATAMGSLSAALNALATSATNDWYIPKFALHRDEAHHVRAARVFTGVFAVLMVIIAVGSAYVKITNPEFRIIPFVLGIGGIFLGPMLGVFLLGMLTKRRGSDLGNVIAILVSLAAMVFLSGQHVEFLKIFAADAAAAKAITPAPWLPVVSFANYALVGGTITFLIGVMFRTPEATVTRAREMAGEAIGQGDKPVSMRG